MISISKQLYELLAERPHSTNELIKLLYNVTEKSSTQFKKSKKVALNQTIRRIRDKKLANIEFNYNTKEYSLLKGVRDVSDYRKIPKHKNGDNRRNDNHRRSIISIEGIPTSLRPRLDNILHRRLSETKTANDETKSICKSCGKPIRTFRLYEELGYLNEDGTIHLCKPKNIGPYNVAQRFIEFHRKENEDVSKLPT